MINPQAGVAAEVSRSSGVVEFLVVNCCEPKCCEATWMGIVLAAYLQGLAFLASRTFDELPNILTFFLA